MTWKDTIRKRAESFSCGCALDYEGMPPEHELVHYPCDKSERGEVCEFSVAMVSRHPEYYKRNNKEMYNKVMRIKSD